MVTPTLPWADVPVPDNFPDEEISPNTPSKPLLAQREGRFLLSLTPCGCALLSGVVQSEEVPLGAVSTVDWSAPWTG